MDIKEMSNKVANNMLEFLIDPTVFPVKQRLYFRPEEILQNEVYEDAKKDAGKAYGAQRKNSDFYPIKNRSSQKEAIPMDRKTFIASMEALSQELQESDPMATDLRTMAYACSRMADDEFEVRLSKAKTIPCPDCGTKVLEATGYCVKCKKSIKKTAGETLEASDDNWSKKATEIVKKNLLAEFNLSAGKVKGPGKPDGTGPWSETPECQKKAEITPKEVQTAEVVQAEVKEVPVVAEVKEVQAAKKEVEVPVVPVEKKGELEDLPEVLPDPVLPPPPAETATVNIKGPKEINITLASLDFGGVEMDARMVSADDANITADEMKQLDQLFR